LHGGTEEFEKEFRHNIQSLGSNLYSVSAEYEAGVTKARLRNSLTTTVIIQLNSLIIIIISTTSRKIF
jgi:hypothetical protein